MIEMLTMTLPNDSETEIASLAKRMAEQASYEEAWVTGLEIQSFGNNSTSALQQVLQSDNTAARRAAAFWLSDEAEKIPAEIFLKMSTDDDDDIRYYAAYGLGYVHHAEVLPRLRDMMLRDPSAEVRQTAAHSLYPAAQQNASPEAIINDFAYALKHEKSPVVREEIVTSLSYFLGTPVVDKAVKLLVETALQDDSASVVEQARISLSVLLNEPWRDKQLAG